MVMDTALLGLLLMGAAVALLVFGQVNRRVARHALGTGLSTVGDLMTLYAMVSDQVGLGLFTHRVGLQGTLECDQPLHSDLTHSPCAAFRYRVDRLWEEEYEERDAKGNRTRRTRSGSDLVAENERRAPFWLRDATGRLLVVPDGARVDMEKIADRFEPGDRQAAAPWWPVLPIPGGNHRGTRRTVGYRLREEVLPIGSTIYVLGTAADRTGTLAMGRGPEQEGMFLVSLKTREEVVHAARQTMILAHYAALACAPLGLLLLIFSLLYRRG